MRFDHGDAKTIEEIKRLDALLEYAVMHEDEAEAARLAAEIENEKRQLALAIAAVSVIACGALAAAFALRRKKQEGDNPI